ncbi:MAG: hypothetical protein LBP89_02965 [Helicobacteraceae bacterium]|jgi:hypothetical protein|nr:hypothetical protein [Helicobacteraceae bacterium]
MIKRAIRDLDKSYYVSIGGDKEFDYGLDGGISVLGHYIASLVSYEEVLEALLPHKLFVSGPHTDEKPDLNSGSFGRYNPEAIRHIRGVFQETFGDQEFLRETVELYHKHLQPRFDAMLSCYSEINQSASLKAELVEAYETPTRGYFRGHLHSCYDIYDTDTIRTFWLRRAIDGTDLEFYEMLQIIKTAYERTYD